MLLHVKDDEKLSSFREDPAFSIGIRKAFTKEQVKIGDTMDKELAKQAAKTAGNAAAWTAGNIFRLILKIFLTGMLILVTTGMLFACIFAFYVKTSLSSDMEIELDDFTVDLTSAIYYPVAGEPGVYEKHTDLYSKKNTVWVKYNEIPEYMTQAAMAIEDHRFMEHKGVDWYRTLGAVGNMFLSMKDNFGGSTLTQQLIKNLTEYDDVTVQRKLLEIFRALEFEKKYTKEEIMEWYLNVIYLGQSCYGVGTASQTYFGKDAWELSLAECAALVGITNNPSRYDPFTSLANNKERQETILLQMYKQERITQEQYQEAMNEELHFTRGENEAYQYEIRSWYDDMIINDVIRDLMEEKGVSEQIAQNLLYRRGYKIYACIDPEIQAIVDGIYEDPSQIPVGNWNTTQQLQSATVIINPYDGSIVAMSGGVGQKEINFAYCRATIAKRPPGSSFKPIAAYGPAMEKGLITQSTPVNDAAGIKLPGTTWFPLNDNRSYSGVVTIRTGLQRSLNTVAAQIIGLLTPEESYNFLQEKLGFTLDPEDCDYAPLALGQLTRGTTVREMAQAYTAFINNGVFTYARSYSQVTEPARGSGSDTEDVVVIDNSPKTIVAYKEDVAANMTDMLYNAANNGTGREAIISGMPVAGKTGTTSSNKDKYFVGFTPYYVCAVWTGYDTPEGIYNGNPAAQLFRKLMGPIHANLEYKSFPKPGAQSMTSPFGNLNITPSDSPSPSVSPSDEIETTETPNTSATLPPSPTVPVVTTPAITPTPAQTPVATPTPAPTPTPEATQVPPPTQPVPGQETEE